MKTLFRLVALTALIGATLPGLARAAGHDAPDRSPRITTLFDGAKMPSTERTVTVGRRIFVTSGVNLFEVVRGTRGRFEQLSIAEASVARADGQTVPAKFLALASHGRALYATATAFDASGTPFATALYRIELGSRPGSVASISSAPFLGHVAPFMPNGMAVDRRGHLFVSNSFSATTGEAAVLELEIEPGSFAFRESNWLPASEGGAFPNGLQLGSHTLYLASMSSILQIEIGQSGVGQSGVGQSGVGQSGAAGAVTTLYTASAGDFLDDFTLVPGGLIVCEIANPFAAPAGTKAQLTIVTRTGPNPGAVVGVIPLEDAGITPSSVTRFRGGAFGNGELLVTDYAGGGLFTVGF